MVKIDSKTWVRIATTCLKTQIRHGVFLTTAIIFISFIISAAVLVETQQLDVIIPSFGMMVFLSFIAAYGFIHWTIGMFKESRNHFQAALYEAVDKTD